MENQRFKILGTAQMQNYKNGSLEYKISSMVGFDPEAVIITATEKEIEVFKNASDDDLNDFDTLDQWFNDIKYII
ncbi:MAG: hypothetical protein U9P90_02140 [Patescibacteria group bacterium]|nr:hypothetical protein [Patescibacteria group bacterium]